ncbi:glycosyltransferase [Synechococcus sp. HB1133]|uniref:glycosyltransferase n=1 Tax=unclassified Synechococcus TaxID=2626047 RepID=UPI00140B7C75|nr:glycosyltransferase [Synechococcus sp. PH41509]MCB4422379.1 glycosyltransferase [Synechococcus sp. HB1133]MCB4429516.1 glycosyltransferase [Synechococcus sp. HBA1120]NHI81323.1 glycosyltransferase [Synechococcus sp. HB1133]
MTLALLEPVLLLATATAASAGLLILQLGLRRVFAVAPRLKPAQEVSAPDTSLTVVIPAFNEAHNIADCLGSVLASAPPCRDWSVVVVDDESTDATVENAIRAGSTASRFRLIKAGPRPADERWVGKNWACSKAVEQVSSDWLLFIDADVRLKPDALQRALAQAVDEHADLLSLAPRLSCGCLAEWMVQPIMASLLGLGFPILETNNPESPVAFAAGPFMLFKASTYECIGGHRALAGEVVEDLALARAIKAGGYRLSYLLGLDAVDLRMYADLAALWEGWTKNWFLGLDRDPAKAIGAALVVVLMFTVPWLLLPTSLVLLWLQPVLSVAWLWLMASAGLAIVQQLLLRLWTRSTFDVPIRYWYLMGVGGLLVGAIGPVSIWRTRTGRGWTWKGRALG